MKVKVEQLKSAGIQTGMALAGFVGGHVANQFAPAQVQKFVAPGTIVLGLGLAAVAKQSAVQAFGVGLATHGAIRTVNNFTAPSLDAEGNEIAATGIKAMIGNYVPSLNGLGYTEYEGMEYAEYPSYEETPLLMGLEPESPENEEWM
jgi:hypothetical protein